jgi:hypothetical protein
MSTHAAEAALVRELASIQRLHDERSVDAALDATLAHIADWQGRRLEQTYADLALQPRYRAAIAFFRSDLYGNERMARRDADVARVVPIMVRTLPESVIATLAQAMELNVLSHALDRKLIAHLPAVPFSVAQYCEAYRRAADYASRKRQIDLIVEIGRALDRYVKKPLLRGALAMMRQPARLAGLGALHDFLERGFVAFRTMQGATYFVATIESRETLLHQAIAAGANAPFPDPGAVTPASS